MRRRDRENVDPDRSLEDKVDPKIRAQRERVVDVELRFGKRAVGLSGQTAVPRKGVGERGDGCVRASDVYEFRVLV